MKIDIPNCPVMFTREELAELLEMRAASSQEAMSRQLLAKGAVALRKEVVELNRVRGLLETCQRQLLAMRITFGLAVIGLLIYGFTLPGPWLALTACLSPIAVVLVEDAASHWPKLFKQRTTKPQHEPEVRK